MVLSRGSIGTACAAISERASGLIMTSIEAVRTEAVPVFPVTLPVISVTVSYIPVSASMIFTLRPLSDFY